MDIKVSQLPVVQDGYYVEEYELSNDDDFRICLTNFGATLESILWPAGSKKHQDILLGYDHTMDWLEDDSWFGATAGRCCNRIRNSEVAINDVQYKLNANTPPHQLHGGLRGFNKRNWRGIPFEKDKTIGVQFFYLSRHLEEGFPGNLSVEAIFTLNNKNEITIQYKANTDQTTICNITCHPYYNLDQSENILNHQLFINADRITPVDADLIPLGNYMDVAGSAFDFRKSSEIGPRLNQADPQLSIAKGFDHNYVLNSADITVKSASLKSKFRTIDFYTNQQGIQFYTGNHFNHHKGKSAIGYSRYAGLCLETQGLPDAANNPEFPSVILHPGHTYHSITKLVLQEN